MRRNAECKMQDAKLWGRALFCILHFAFCILVAACAPSGPATTPNDREWNLLTADYQWLDTLRKAQVVPPATASRKQQIEARLANMQKVQPVYEAFVAKLTEYYQRTHDQ